MACLSAHTLLRVVGTQMRLLLSLRKHECTICPRPEMKVGEHTYSGERDLSRNKGQIKKGASSLRDTDCVCVLCEHGWSVGFPLNSSKSTTAPSLPSPAFPQFLLYCVPHFPAVLPLPFRLQLSKSFGRVMCQLVFRRTRGPRVESRRARRRERPQGRGREEEGSKKRGALFAHPPSVQEKPFLVHSTRLASTREK